MTLDRLFLIALLSRLFEIDQASLESDSGKAHVNPISSSYLSAGLVHE
jgi:hypothetical protein